MPSSPVIATFDGASPTAFADWGTAPLVGGTFVYPTCSPGPPEPNYPIFADYSSSNWNITGVVGDFSGFGVWWDVQSGVMNGFPTYAGGLIDASAYVGIQFDVSGNAGPLGVLTFAPTSSNQQSLSTDPKRPNCGSCNPDAGECDVVAVSSVSGLTSVPKTVRILWTDLTTARGQPLDPAKLAGISWFFPWVQGATPYPVDITLANIGFIPASSGDAGGD